MKNLLNIKNMKYFDLKIENYTQKSVFFLNYQFKKFLLHPETQKPKINLCGKVWQSVATAK